MNPYEQCIGSHRFTFSLSTSKVEITVSCNRAKWYVLPYTLRSCCPCFTPGCTLGHPREKAQVETVTGTDSSSQQCFCFENCRKVRAPLCQQFEGKYSFLTAGLRDTFLWLGCLQRLGTRHSGSEYQCQMTPVLLRFFLRLKEAFYFYFCRWSITFYSERLIDFHRTIKMVYKIVFWHTTVKWNIIKMPICIILPGEDKA